MDKYQAREIGRAIARLRLNTYEEVPYERSSDRVFRLPSAKGGEYVVTAHTRDDELWVVCCCPQYRKSRNRWVQELVAGTLPLDRPGCKHTRVVGLVVEGTSIEDAKFTIPDDLRTEAETAFHLEAKQLMLHQPKWVKSA